MKIGILGGTFNPIHFGHLVLAEEVKEALTLDKVIFVPANLPPHKDDKDVIPSEHRLKMVKLATKDNPHFSVSDIEIRRKGKSYSVDTLKEFKKRFAKDRELFFIVGSDAITYLREWKDVGELFKLAHFVMATRPGYALNEENSNILTVSIKAIDISAFEIRQRIKEDKSIRYLVPEAVRRYIIRKELYLK